MRDWHTVTAQYRAERGKGRDFSDGNLVLGCLVGQEGKESPARDYAREKCASDWMASHQ